MARASEESQTGGKTVGSQGMGDDEPKGSSGHPRHPSSLCLPAQSIRYLFPKLDSSWWEFQGDFKGMGKVIFYPWDLQISNRLRRDIRGHLVQPTSDNFMPRGVLARVTHELIDTSKLTLASKAQTQSLVILKELYRRENVNIIFLTIKSTEY